ncbi:Ldh family oxidoreductase [Roseomonas sp. 18066]|uniref:Ldh family oxidoreductase n=1 Tax=Roseomonas sp. 18066 TaxID=2681412 RepID=UPI00135761E0|nr:Ldh family oxidoreductase [Roseomonas sp. 18066]
MTRYPAAALLATTTALFRQGGMDADKAQVFAETLIEGDLLGHDTHGLNLLPQYLDGLAAGDMLGTGEPTIVADVAAGQTWDGRKLPGPWLVRKAADLASERAKETGIYAVSIRRAHHIACLAAYPERITARGQMMIVTCADPATASVAPFGGTRRLYTPDPLAAGWPTDAGPVIIDVSMSYTTNGMTNRLANEGGSFPHNWLLDRDGTPTSDPSAFAEEGTLQPLGGAAGAGHKGFALGLLIEALTCALSGYARADEPKGWGAAVLVLVIDPGRFGSTDAFTRETGWMVAQSRANPPISGGPPVRTPGERGLQRKADQLANGVKLHPAIPPMLADRCKRAGIEMPKSM